MRTSVFRAEIPNTSESLLYFTLLLSKQMSAIVYSVIYVYGHSETKLIVGLLVAFGADVLFDFFDRRPYMGGG